MIEDAALRALVDRDEIADVVTALFVATDSRDWARVRRCLAPVVTFDMTSLTSGDVQRLSPDAIASGWEAGLARIEHVHHQIGNLRISVRADEAAASCYGIAYHFRRTASGRNTRVFVGGYEFHLARLEGEWRIDLFRFNLKFIDGNTSLETEP